jgi:hypothetical protein
VNWIQLAACGVQTLKTAINFSVLYNGKFIDHLISMRLFMKELASWSYALIVHGRLLFGFLITFSPYLVVSV